MTRAGGRRRVRLIAAVAAGALAVAAGPVAEALTEETLQAAYDIRVRA